MASALGFKPPNSFVDTAGAAFLGITWAAVFARLWTRGVMLRALGWDDYTAFISQIFFTVFTTALIIDFRTIKDPAFERLQQHAVNKAIDWLLVGSVFYIATMLVFKISLGLFFLRVTNLAWQRRLIYVMMGISTLISFVYLFFPIFQCGYPKDGWTFLMRNLQGKCMSSAAKLGMSYTHAIAVSLTDIVFAILPIFLLNQAQMEFRFKVVAYILMILGTAGSICSIVRIQYIPLLAEPQLGFFASAADFAIWTILEPGIGITASCLATLRPLVRSILGWKTPLSFSRASRRHHIPLQEVHRGNGPSSKDLPTTMGSDELSTVMSGKSSKYMGSTNGTTT